MKFVRIALGEFIGLKEPIKPTRLTGDFGEVQIHRAPLKQGDDRALYLSIGISTSPMLSIKDDELFIDEPGRLKLESYVQGAIDAVALSYGCERRIWSHLVPYAIQTDDAGEMSQCASLKTFDHEMKIRWAASWSGITPTDYPQALMDRLEGAALMTECASNSSVLGQYRECVRLFELAFRLKPKMLEVPLSAFLGKAPHQYSRLEVADWLALRDHASHADKLISNRLAFDRDVRHFIDRIRQAAMEVLFNKAEWHKDSVGRRTVWAPLIGLLPGSGLQGTPGNPFSIKIAPLDCFYVWPLWTEAAFLMLPPGWW
jgi:hypothetical protein